MKSLFFAIALMALVVPSLAYAASPDEQRAAIQKMETDTLNRLYKEKPDTKREIAEANGYAVFSNGELAVIWLSGGYGHGIAHSRNGQSVYMQMAKAGVGLGLGAKDFNTVFVFHDSEAFHKFTTTGLDLSGTADAAAKSGVKGNAASGAADVIPGVRIYQMTDSGLMAQAMLQGTKYWRDDELNGVTTTHTSQ